MTDLSTSVSTISSEALDKLFAETPVIQVNADDLKIPTGDDDKKEVKVVKKDTIDFDDVDLDKLDAQSTAGTSGTQGTSGTSADTSGTSGTSGDSSTAATSGTAGTSAENQEEIAQRNEFLKNSVNYLIEKGLFKDFEGREDLEVTEEIFSQLLEQQVKKQIEEGYETKKKSAGEYGEAILEYLDNGGEADKIIDLFKER